MSLTRTVRPRARAFPVLFIFCCWQKMVLVSVDRVVNLNCGSHCLTHRSVCAVRRAGHSQEVRKHVSSSYHFCRHRQLAMDYACKDGDYCDLVYYGEGKNQLI